MTIEDIKTRKEGQAFDCKSIRIDPKALAVPIVAMANADGGLLAIGISDKSRKIDGVDQKTDKLNELLRIPFDLCNPSIPVKYSCLPYMEFFCNPKIASFLKVYHYVKQYGEGIDRVCREQETNGARIPFFHTDEFILKITVPNVMANVSGARIETEHKQSLS